MRGVFAQLQRGGGVVFGLLALAHHRQRLRQVDVGGGAGLLAEDLRVHAVLRRVVQCQRGLQAVLRGCEFALEVHRGAHCQLHFQLHAVVAAVFHQAPQLFSQVARDLQVCAHHVVGPQAEEHRHDLRRVADGRADLARLAVRELHARVGVTARRHQQGAECDQQAQLALHPLRPHRQRAHQVQRALQVAAGFGLG